MRLGISWKPDRSCSRLSAARGFVFCCRCGHVVNAAALSIISTSFGRRTMGRFSLRVPGVLEDIGHPTNIATHERSLHLVGVCLQLAHRLIASELDWGAPRTGPYCVWPAIRRGRPRCRKGHCLRAIGGDERPLPDQAPMRSASSSVSMTSRPSSSRRASRR